MYSRYHKKRPDDSPQQRDQQFGYGHVAQVEYAAAEFAVRCLPLSAKVCIWMSCASAR